MHSLMKVTIHLLPELFFRYFRSLSIIVIFWLSLSNTALAWVYSEHRDIAMQAVQNLNVQYQADFDTLWRSSRSGFEKKLCESAADSTQGLIHLSAQIFSDVSVQVKNKS